MPSLSTDGTAWTYSGPMINLTPVLIYLRLPSTMAWNVSEFTIKLFRWNYLMATLRSYSNVYFKLSTVVAILLKLLSSV